MKNVFYAQIIAFCILTNAIAQEEQETASGKVREFGIGLNSFNSFSLQYRWGNEKRLFRISGNIGTSTSEYDSFYNENYIQDTINSTSSTVTKTNYPLTINTGISFSILKKK